MFIFRQSVPAGQQGLSDFSHPNTVITFQDKVFTHLLYQSRFAYSGWRYVQLVLGGESYSALVDGLQSALTLAGGSPLEHRTDSLNAAFNNQREEQTLTQSYEALVRIIDYGPPAIIAASAVRMVRLNVPMAPSSTGGIKP